MDESNSKWEHLAELKVDIPIARFWNAMEIWLKKPHTVNRRLCGAKEIHQADVNITEENILKNIDEIIEGVKDESNIPHLFSHIQQNQQNNTSSLTLIVRDMVPKQLDRFHVARELVIKDCVNNEMSFIPLIHINEFGEYQHIDKTLKYKVKYNTDDNMLKVSIGSDYEEPPCTSLGSSSQWLEDVLLKKIVGWCQTENLNTEVTSLRLVPVDKYSLLYQELKAKYGPKLVASWTEKTDPQKFVYEDISIATYLILLWERERAEKGIIQKQSFVDLGCGNGLLVHLLASEGHPGVGIDVRKRKIWDTYGPETVLQENAIEPSDKHLFPQYDWLIGNHSDELTPWIPVIATKSSFTCNYFVLPCCLWDFNCRFSEKRQGISQYRGYLNYVRNIGEKCGFDVEEDTLRIPSTKRICFIGRNRTYKQTDTSQVDKNLSDFIASRSKSVTLKRPLSNADDNDVLGSPSAEHSEHNNENYACGEIGDSNQSGSTLQNCDTNNDKTMTTIGADNTKQWIGHFEAKSSREVTKNCYTIDKSVQLDIVGTVFRAILEASDNQVLRKEDGNKWGKGGSLSLSDAVALIDKEQLQKLKSECGGMQTLLRNHHHVFIVQGGCVALRDLSDPAHLQHQAAKKKRKGQSSNIDHAKLNKTKLCYFHDHHPDGCILSQEKCRFAHGNDDLREKVS